MVGRSYFHRCQHGKRNTGNYYFLYSDRNSHRMFFHCCCNCNRNSITGGDGELANDL
jgi:hypothetical protein